jgi:hypothetical protein
VQRRHTDVSDHDNNHGDDSAGRDDDTGINGDVQPDSPGDCRAVSG